MLLSLKGGSWLLEDWNHYLFFYRKYQVGAIIKDLETGRELIAMIDQATYGSKKDILQREIKFLPRHFIKILEDKQVINWVQI